MNNYLATEKPGKLLLKFAIPCILSLLISSLYNIVDQIFIGHGVGYLGNGATNVVFPLTIIALALALFVGDGTGAYLSICLGKKDFKSAKKAVGSAVSVLLIVSIVLILIFVLKRTEILNTFGATEANLSYAVEYYNYIMIGIPFFIFANALNSVIRADGNPQFAMLSMVIGAIINVLLDAIFIFVFDWGMMGAGLATSLGQIVSAAISITYLGRMNAFKLKLRDLIPNIIIRKSLPLGISSLITQLSIVITIGFTNNALVKYGAFSKYGSDIPLTAFGIVMKVFQIIISIVVGIGIGAQPIIGYNLGSKNYNRIKEVYKIMIRAEIILGIVATFAFEFFPTKILNIFGTENALYSEFGTRAFKIFLSLIILCAIQKSSAIFLQALGKPFLAMTLSLLRDIILNIPLILLLPRYLGVEGLFFTAPIADLLTFIITIFFTKYTMRYLDSMSLTPANNLENRNVVMEPQKLISQNLFE